MKIPKIKLNKKKSYTTYSVDDLERNFNLIIEQENEEIDSGKKFLHNKFWAEKIIYFTIILNSISLILIIFGFLFYITKGDPYVYGTTNKGELYSIPTIGHKEALDIVNKNKQNQQNNSEKVKISGPTPKTMEKPVPSQENLEQTNKINNLQQNLNNSEVKQ